MHILQLLQYSAPVYVVDDRRYGNFMCGSSNAYNGEMKHRKQKKWKT